MQTLVKARPEPARAHYLPVHIDSLDERVLQMDLYLVFDPAREPTLYRAVGIDFTDQDRSTLCDQGVEFLYIPACQHSAYCRMLCARLDRTFRDPAMRREEKNCLVRASCTRIIENFMTMPSQSENLAAIGEVSRTLAAWAAQDAGAFSLLLDMSSHDFYTATHMVNVGVGCGLLAKALCPDDDELVSVMVQGGLLHDAGKREVPPETLNKEGRLDPTEWEQVRRHPVAGYLDLRAHPSVPELALEMVRDHHERLDGRGYPRGLRGAQIGWAARVCAVVDVFDAITSSRSYRGSTPVPDALKIMSEGASKHFDPDILGSWTAVVQDLLAQNPAEPAPTAAGERLMDLEELLPHGDIALDPGDADVGAPAFGERRRHPRVACALPLCAVFLTQGKACDVRTGQVFRLKATDLSLGGLRVQTPWPVSRNDVLQVTFTKRDGSCMFRHARVVSVRQNAAGQWMAGLRFISESAAQHSVRAA